MALVVPDEGELVLLNILLKHTSYSTDFILQLYNNNYTPVAGTTAGAFVAATFDGYSPRTLTRANWYSAATVSNKAESSWGSSPVAWTCTDATGDTVYGYWIVPAGSTFCVWAERFSSARVMSESDVLSIVPKFTLSSE